MNLPTRQPDIVFLSYIKCWKESDHYILVINLKDGEQVVLAVNGNIDVLDSDSIFSMFKALLEKYATRVN
jgi:hypothetical protein